MRVVLVLVLVLVLAASGCLREAERAEAPRVHPDMAPIAVKLVHVAGPRVRAGDAASVRRLEEAVGVASAVVGLDAAIFGGDTIANEEALGAPRELEAFANAAGIIAARRYVVLGERERAGVLGREAVLRELETRKLVAARRPTYADELKRGVRFVALDVSAEGAVSPEARRSFEEALRAAEEKVVIVAADQPPLDKDVQDLLRRDGRVKVVLYRAAQAQVLDEPGEPLWVATPALDSAQPSIRLVDIEGKACRVSLLSVPGGAPRAEATANLRPDGPAR